MVIGAWRAGAQGQTTATFRSGVSNVRVDVQVLDAGNPVPGLMQSDFQVWDEGVPQQILYVDRGAEPLSLVLLLDVSGSMRKYVEQVADVARQSLHFLRQRDRVAVMIFARSSKVRHDFTDVLGEIAVDIREAVHDESVGSATEINRGLLDAAHYIDEKAGPGRKAILILTDNKGLNYKAPDDEVIDAMYAGDIVVNALVIGKGDMPEVPKPGRYVNPDFTHPNVFRIAEQTGGEGVKAEEARQVFPRMIERIRTRYALQYRTPENARPGFRRLRVDLTAAARTRYPNAVLRYRRGYYVRG